MKRAGWLVVLVMVFAVAQVVGVNAQSMLEKNIALADKYHLEIIQQEKGEMIAEVFTPDCKIHLGAPSDLPCHERALQIAQGDWRGYPNKGTNFIHDNHVAHGNLVAFHWTMTGTRADGGTDHWEGLDLLRIENGKVAELWVELHRIETETE